MRQVVQPVQQRAVPTVQSAIDVTIALIEERGEGALRLADVIERSGVSSGSLTHHFGSREGLVAAALATRFDRVAVARTRSFAEMARVSPDPAVLLLPMLTGSFDDSRREARRARVRSLSSARHRVDLRAALAASIRSVEQSIARNVASGEWDAVIAHGVSPTQLAMFAETASLGLLLEERLAVPLPKEEWSSLHLAILEAIITPEVHARMREAVVTTADPSTVRLETAPTSAPAPGTGPGPMPRLQLTSDEHAIVRHVIEVLRSEGSEAVTVARACEATGVSRGWFTRRFGSCDELLDLARIAGMLGRVESEVALYEQVFGGAMDGLALTAALSELPARSTTDGFLGLAWDRLEAVVVAETHGAFARDAGAVTAWVLDGIALAVASAQRRGIVRSDVSPAALARFLWSYPLAYLVAEVAGVPAEERLALAVRTLRTFATS